MTEQDTIHAAYAGVTDLESAREAVEWAVAGLDRGEIRVAEKKGGNWVVNGWAMEAILLYFRLRDMETFEIGPYEFHDKIPLKSGLAAQGIRVVPPGTVRYGAHCERGVVVMPGYVNIGAYVGSGTMVDTWATVGSCAQIGRDVHLSGGVGIGGVLEPPGATPVIIEDGAFIGSRSIVVEGTIVEEKAVLGANTVLTRSTPIIDVTGPEPVEYRGRVPARSVVVPGTRPKQFPSGSYDLACALIIGKRTEATDEKTALNEYMRGIGRPALTDLVETLVWLVDIPSVTGAEAALRDAIAARLEGMPRLLIGDSLVVGEAGPGKVILAGHLDTVPLQGQGTAVIRDDRVHGLGSTDMKGGLAVMIGLLESLGPQAIVAVFYAGEEGPIAGNQLGMVLDEAPWLAEAEAGIVLEPTDRAVEAGCQGVINANVVFTGEPAHSARPWLGENAITKAADFLTFMRDLEPELHTVGGLEFREVISVTLAHGGVAKNVIPAEFEMNLNYRFAPDRPIPEAESRLRGVSAMADRIEITDLAPAGDVATDHPLFRDLIDRSGAGVVGKQGWTDVARLSAAGVPAINFGPGEPSLAHKPGESVRLSDLDWAYDSLLEVLR